MVSWIDIGQIAVVCAVTLALIWIYLSRPATARKIRMARDRPAGTIYQVYTRTFDQCVQARELLDVLGKISPDKERGFVCSGDNDWRENIGAFESAGHRDAGNLDELQFNYRSECAITFLVDQSGSLRDERLIESLRAVWDVATWLTAQGAKIEVLGFTTAGWHGGFAKSQWVAANRPKYPGRLAALLHVIYKGFSEPAFEYEPWRMILHPDARRENIDGEALEWAVERLNLRAETVRLLVVVSDGSPVDDASLAANGPSFLDRHLSNVIASISGNPDVTLIGVGVGHDVSGWYGNQIMLNGQSEPALAVAKFIVANVESCIENRA